jgi:O-methyltransferase involved in polyketide biosynthesis
VEEMLMRTMLLDHVLDEALDDGITQLVILGAGLDARVSLRSFHGVR